MRAQLRSTLLASSPSASPPPKCTPLARETKTRCPRDPDNPRNQPRVRRPLSPPPLPLRRERARLARVPRVPEPRMRSLPPPWLRAHRSMNQLNGSGSLNIAPSQPPQKPTTPNGHPTSLRSYVRPYCYPLSLPRDPTHRRRGTGSWCEKVSLTPDPCS